MELTKIVKKQLHRSPIMQDGYIYSVWQLEDGLYACYRQKDGKGEYQPFTAAMRESQAFRCYVTRLAELMRIRTCDCDCDY